MQAALRDLGERLGELDEQYQALQPTPPAAAGGHGRPGLPGSGRGRPGAGRTRPVASLRPLPAAAATPRRPRPRALQPGLCRLRARQLRPRRAGLHRVPEDYPGTDFTDNAQYWIGECLYGKKQYDEAIEAWNTLFRDYPSSDKLPDARVKKGMALERLGRRSQALVEYRYVVDRFPNSPAARIARETLNP